METLIQTKMWPMNENRQLLLWWPNLIPSSKLQECVVTVLFLTSTPLVNTTNIQAQIFRNWRVNFDFWNVKIIPVKCQIRMGAKKIALSIFPPYNITLSAPANIVIRFWNRLCSLAWYYFAPQMIHWIWALAMNKKEKIFLSVEYLEVLGRKKTYKRRRRRRWKV